MSRGLTQLLNEIRRRGLTLQRLAPRSAAVRLTGPGVDVRAAGLSLLTDADLLPVTGRDRRG